MDTSKQSSEAKEVIEFNNLSKTYYQGLDEFELSIIEVLNKYLQDVLNEETEVWTKQLKVNLGKLGEEKGFKVCTSGLKENGYWREWLYDMVWYKETSHNGTEYFSELPFVMECEWAVNFTEIKYDFEKLLVANAEHRLMICNSNENRVEELFSFFNEAVLRYSHNHKGDRYLIAIFNLKEKKFHYRVIQK